MWTARRAAAFRRARRARRARPARRRAHRARRARYNHKLLHFESRRLIRHWSRVTAPNPPDCSSSDCSSTDPNMPSLDYSSDEYF